jgi:hypothetical protein
MSRYAKLFVARAISVAGLSFAGLAVAALALSSSAAADPAAAPVVPGVPALSMIQDLANPAGVGAVLQTAATALNGASSMIGAPSPNALPVSPIAIPGAAPVPAAPITPQLGIGATVMPLLNQLGVPAQLVSLAPTNLLGTATPTYPGVPAYQPAPTTYPALPAAPGYPISPAAPGYPASPAVPGYPAPAAVPAAAPVDPAAGGLNPLTLITALP